MREEAAMAGKSDRDGPGIGVLMPPWITAIAVLITALVAAGTFFAGRATAPAGSPKPAVTITVTQTATPQASKSGSGGTHSPSTLLASKSGLVLSQNFALSFTDPTLRPFSNGSSCSGDLYVCFEGVGSSSPLAVYPGRAGFSQCQEDTTYVSTFANPNRQSLVGETLCVTTSNRIAACYVTSDTTETNNPAPALTMDVTVYATK
jgi:hypothetical protein